MGYRWHPNEANRHIDSALSYAVGSIYDSHDPIYHTLNSIDRRIPIPETMTMVKSVQFRDRFTYSPVVQHQMTWEGAGVTVEIDDFDYRIRPSIRITTPAVDMKARTGQEIDLSGMTHLEGWLKSDVARTFNVTFYEDDTDKGEVAVSLDASKWTYIRLELPEDRNSLRDIDNVRLTDIDPRSGTLWVNGLFAINDFSIEWESVNDLMWEVDRQTKELLIQLPNQAAGYGGTRHNGIYSGIYGTAYMTYANPLENVVRVVGGRDPGPLADDDSETVVPAAFVVTKATQLAFGAESGGPQTDLDRLREQQRIWDARAEREKRRFPPLINVRRVR